MNRLQRLLGVGAIALATIGLSGCASLDTEKQKSITQFIPERCVETRVVDINKDRYLDMVYLTKLKNGYELKVMKGNNDGSFRDPESIRNYGEIDPRTLNFLTFFYHDVQKVIDGQVR